MILNGVVLRVNPGNLLVRDLGNGQEVLVHFHDSRRFSAGDCVRIIFRGAMTFSIPPQITAASIQRTQCRRPEPPAPQRPGMSEMRAVILERRHGSLLVRDMSNNRQFIVHTPHSQHFCPRQRIIIKYDSIVMNNPPEIRAAELAAIC